MSRKVMLDAFCCSGGAGAGYDRAGWEVIGVDIEPQPNYPFEFHQGDAVEFIKKYGHTFDAIHTSPPCQSQTALTKGTNKGREYPNFIPQTRAALEELDLPYIIENVQGSEVRKDVVLCGEMFDLRVLRHRYFELGNWMTQAPAHKKHRGRVAGWRHGEYFDGPYFAVYGLGGGKGTVEQWQDAMGIHWTTDRRELAEAIPPAYTEFLGARLLEMIS